LPPNEQPRAGHQVLRPRASAVVIRQGRVLLCRSAGDTYWALPGGVIEPGEMSDHAALREFAEEVGAQAQIVRLLWVVENHFEDHGRRFQEIGFYYLAALDAAACAFQPGEFAGGEPELLLHWVALDELDRIDVRPSFLRIGLRDLPERVVHMQTVGI
jgi:ADP-ribose pyrophosphatase YjhB (NUDIX family)